jgi:2'-5' RNA ligase
MKRLFVAIKINPDKELLRVYNEIRRRCHAGKIKWVDVNLFHLTLKFLGETPGEDVNTITNVLKEVAGSSSGFSFDLKGLGIFGSSYRPRIIRANVENNTQLKAFGNTVLSKLEKAGFPSDRQNFVPHLTLGRIKYIQDKKMLQEIISEYQIVLFQTVRIEEFILYESILHPSGPEYVILEKYKLS